MHKKERDEILSMAIEMHKLDKEKFYEIKGILKGILLYSKKMKNMNCLNCVDRNDNKTI